MKQPDTEFPLDRGIQLLREKGLPATMGDETIPPEEKLALEMYVLTLLSVFSNCGQYLNAIYTILSHKYDRTPTEEEMLARLKKDKCHVFLKVYEIHRDMENQTLEEFLKTLDAWFSKYKSWLENNMPLYLEMTPTDEQLFS